MEKGRHGRVEIVACDPTPRSACFCHAIGLRAMQVSPPEVRFAPRRVPSSRHQPIAPLACRRRSPDQGATSAAEEVMPTARRRSVRRLQCRSAASCGRWPPCQELPPDREQGLGGLGRHRKRPAPGDDLEVRSAQPASRRDRDAAGPIGGHPLTEARACPPGPAKVGDRR